MRDGVCRKLKVVRKASFSGRLFQSKLAWTCTRPDHALDQLLIKREELRNMKQCARKCFLETHCYKKACTSVVQKNGNRIQQLLGAARQNLFQRTIVI